MCLVIDTCCIASLLNPHDRNHDQFTPVLAWIASGKGRMIYGGTKYARELRTLARYTPAIAEFTRSGRVVKLEDAQVDAVARRVRQLVNDRRMDDEHLIAIMIVSGCRVICTNDNRAIRYLKMRNLYAHHKRKRPRIYRSLRNAHLCSDANLIPACRR